MQEIEINTNNECGLDFYEICDNIKRSGFNNIMIALLCGKEEEQFAYAKKLGLNVVFVHLDNTQTNNMWVKGFAHNKVMALYKKQIELCSKFGAWSLSRTKQSLDKANGGAMKDFERNVLYILSDIAHNYVNIDKISIDPNNAPSLYDSYGR